MAHSDLNIFFTASNPRGAKVGVFLLFEKISPTSVPQSSPEEAFEYSYVQPGISSKAGF